MSSIKSTLEQINTKKIIGQDYKYTAMVNHRGTAVAFAMDRDGRIKYTVLDLSSGSNEEKADGKGGMDKDYWSLGDKGPREVYFPHELSQSGYAVTPNYSMPPRGKDGALLTNTSYTSQLDPFHSSTARLTAQAPFQVLSDGQYIYIFRQSLPGDDGRVDKVNGAPIADGTLLADRFVLSGTVLVPSKEIRYQRSGHKTRPASKKDTYSSVDMDKKPFYEPTVEFSFARNLINGGFSVLIIPTQETEVSKWQIFFYDRESQKVNSVNVNRAADGWLDPTNSKAFIDGFLAENGLGANFIHKTHERIRDNKTDAEIATVLKEQFSGELDGIEEGEIAEVVFAIRTGLVKDDFSFAGNYRVETGLSALYYYQQELDDFGKPIKNKACVMLAMGLKKDNEDKNYLAALNFAVAGDGSLSRVSKEDLVLPELDMDSANQEELLDEIKKLDGQVVDLRGDIDKEREDMVDEIEQELGGWSPPETAQPIPNPVTDELKKECLEFTSNVENMDAAIAASEKRSKNYKNARNILDGCLKELKTSTLPVSDRQEYASFGGSVATNDNYVIVGAHGVTGGGAAYIFKYKSERWQEIEKLHASDRQPRDHFGASVAISGNHAIVGADGVTDGGAAYIFEYKSERWQEIKKLYASDRQPENHFGASVAISGNHAIVGAGGVTGGGAAYIFERGHDFWKEIQKLEVSDTKKNDGFGQSVAISNNYAIVGSPFQNTSAADASGAAYIFERKNSRWTQVQKLDGSEYGSDFGLSVAISDKHAVVGARMENTGGTNDAGAAYVFERKSSNWTQVRKLQAPDKEQDDQFGYSVAISANHAIIGAYSKDIDGRNAGAAYIFAPIFQRVVVSKNQYVLKYSWKGDITKDDRPTLSRLRGFEKDATLPFYGRVKQKLVDLGETQTQLNEKQKQFKTGLSNVPMPLIEMDGHGLASSGGLLKFGYTADEPHLFEDSLGRVNLYFSGQNHQFFAAYFNPRGGKKSLCSPAEQKEFSLKPRLAVDLEVRVVAECPAGSNACTLVMTDAKTDREVENWKVLPRGSEQVAAILNGNPECYFGYLAEDYDGAPPGGVITVGCKAGNSFFPTKSLSGLAVKNGRETDLSDFLDANRVLVVGTKVFTILEHTQARVKIGQLSKKSLHGIVSELDHVDLIWEHLEAWEIIKEADDDPNKGIFVSEAVLGTEAEIKSALALTDPVTYAEDELVKLIRQATDERRITFQVRDANRPEVDHLAAGLDVEIRYDYYGNFTCSPANLSSGIAIAEEWKGDRSYLFQARASGAMDMEGFTAKTYRITNALGQWEAYDPGLAISFDRALETENREGKVGVLAARDTSTINLRKLHPTTRGLTLEAWINPREITNREDLSKVIQYRCGKEGYTLGIEKKEDQYQCFATVGDKRVRVKQNHGFGHWRHLAVTYKRFWALRLSNAAIECGNNLELNLSGEYTIEAFVECDGIGKILAKGNAYCLELRQKNDKDKCCEEKDKGIYVVSFKIAGQEGLVCTCLEKGFHKIAVIRSRDRIKDSASSHDYPITAGSDAGNGCGNNKWWKDKESDEVIEGLAEESDKLCNKMDPRKTFGAGFAKGGMTIDAESPTEKYYFTIVVDGAKKADTGEPIEENNRNRDFSNLRIGELDGVIDEARIWDRALAINECGKRDPANKDALVAWWRMSEGEDRFVYDSTGQNHGTIEEGKGNYQWMDSPDTELPRFGFYVDGQRADTTVSERALPEGPDQFTLGGNQSADGSYTEHFDGILEEVRIWGVARSAEEISDNVFGRLIGEREKLLANYTFDTDFAAAKKANLAGIEGITESDADKIWNRLLDDDVITVDGALVKSEDNLRASLDSFGLEKAILDEILEVIKSTPELHDSSYNSITLQVEGQIWSGQVGKENVAQVLSTAPVSTEIPAIRSALSGIRTDYNGTLSGAPAVVEYGDVQPNDDGTVNGILKRCYAYIRDGQWHLVTGYKVGNLVTEWFGQAQYNPQVIGYIEGPPPVPGENFRIGKDEDADTYASSVTFEEAEEVTYICSSSKESGSMTAAESEAKVGAGFMTIIAPIGLGMGLEGKGGGYFKSEFESSNSWSEGFERSVGINTTRVMSAALAGYENGEKGSERYYKPGNTGYALVKSKTADIYVMRLEHNNAMVSLYYQPNPDIPEDQNIIPFPINPLYTKQGTLDGKFGEKTDEHYPSAHAYGEYSYYKPREAYALRNRIEREKQQAQAYYEDFNTGFGDEMAAASAVMGAVQLLGLIPGAGPAIAGLANSLIGMGGGALWHSLRDVQKDTADMVSQRNLVNTYVWTVDGGFYTESTEISETQQETYGGNFSLSSSGGMGAYYDFEAGGTLEQTSLFAIGSSFTMTKSKTKEAGKSFGLDVSVDIPTSPRYRYDGLTMKKDLDPGTVDAYRFMSFYLEPEANNYEELFSKVIDPKWLAESPDPNAMALRQARNDDKKPFCWRVMHRVTFVSRILPEFEPDAPPSLEKNLRARNIESNYGLIKLFEPYVANLTEPDAFFTKVDEILDVRLPEFADYKREIKEYLGLYYDIA